VSREWRFYIDDMIDCAEKALAYTEGLDQTRFVQSGLNYDATLRNLELIGEAATHVPDHVRQFAGRIDWRRIVATRNRLIHGYLGIDNDIPALLAQLHELKAAAEAGRIPDPPA
jgi:uncharacterized protein with HEPN domain